MLLLCFIHEYYLPLSRVRDLVLTNLVATPVSGSFVPSWLTEDWFPFCFLFFSLDDCNEINQFSTHVCCFFSSCRVFSCSGMSTFTTEKSKVGLLKYLDGIPNNGVFTLTESDSETDTENVTIDVDGRAWIPFLKFIEYFSVSVSVNIHLHLSNQDKKF